MRHALALVFPLLLLACDRTDKPLPDGGVVVKPPPSVFDVNLFPPLPGGTKLFAEATNVRFELDPTTKDAISALGLCADAVAYCYDPAGRDLADCLASTRSCDTTTPWNETACCPQPCKDAFVDRLDAGAAQYDAFEQVFFLAPDCFPGVRAALEGP